MARSIGGLFDSNPGRRRRRLASLAAAGLLTCCALPLCAEDGDPDPLFGGGDGRSLLLWDGDGGEAQAVEAASGGQLLVAGRIGPSPHRWGIVKLDAAGEPVPGSDLAISLAGDGALATDEVFDLALDANGRTLVTGWVEIEGDLYRPALARLTAAGALDPGFGGDGVRIATSVPAGWQISLITDAQALPDGRALFVGQCAVCLPGGEQGNFVLRTTAAGAPDPAFSGDGWLAFEIPTDEFNLATAVEVDSAGRVVVAGRGTVGGSLLICFVTRFTAAGALDTLFGDVDNGVAPLTIVGDNEPMDSRSTRRADGSSWRSVTGT